MTQLAEKLTVFLRILDHLVGCADGVLQLTVVLLQAVQLQVQVAETLQDIDGRRVSICCYSFSGCEFCRCVYEAVCEGKRLRA